MRFKETPVDARSRIAKRPLLAAILFLLVGILLGTVIRPGEGPPERQSADVESMQSTNEQDQATMWTCSMHPQIHKDQPGQCPLCGMDLIPVQKQTAGGLRTLTVSPEARALMNIQTVPVERKFVSVVVRMAGKVEYDETRRGYIAAWVPGRLDRLYVDYTGVTVKKGDHLVYIYSPELYSVQEELIQAIRFAAERGDRANPGGINLVESAREKLRLLGLTEEQIRRIEGQEGPTDHITIYAPTGGIVIEKLRQEGDYVKTGERIYTIANLDQVWVMLDAYESDLIWLRYGQGVTFTTEAYPGEEFVGRISFIQPVLNDRTRTVKVRVNVPNPKRKLKPDMFVRGIVQAKVAEGGEVIGVDLAGKWISPMHPEIVKDQPGTCDICGMDLVSAESLGYVTASDRLRRAPLVIPTTAALVTGTRAVVYVEQPDAEEPTFEGRVVVLGPRAGDYYLVRQGLEEGELVVAQGTFKIDSEMQIRAKPSMMTPEGGGGGGHVHAGSGTKSLETSTSGADHAGHASMQVTVPAAFQSQLASLWQPYLRLQAALASDDSAEMALAVRQFSSAFRAIDASKLDDRGQEVWNLPHSQIAAAVQVMLSTDQIEDVRVQFEPLSDNLTTLVETLGMGDVGAVYQLHCSMAFDNRGASWLQDNPEVRNPYFGSKMLRCADPARQIVGKEQLKNNSGSSP